MQSTNYFNNFSQHVHYRQMNFSIIFFLLFLLPTQRPMHMKIHLFDEIGALDDVIDVTRTCSIRYGYHHPKTVLWPASVNWIAHNNVYTQIYYHHQKKKKGFMAMAPPWSSRFDFMTFFRMLSSICTHTHAQTEVILQRKESSWKKIEAKRIKSEYGKSHSASAFFVCEHIRFYLTAQIHTHLCGFSVHW